MLDWTDLQQAVEAVEPGQNIVYPEALQPAPAPLKGEPHIDPATIEAAPEQAVVEEPAPAVAAPAPSAPVSLAPLPVAPQAKALAPAKPAPERKAKLMQGKFKACGHAPYDFDPKLKPSFYVLTEDDQGKEQIMWGIDLARAFEETKVTPGQAIRVRNIGFRDVNVPQPDGSPANPVKRNAYVVDLPRPDGSFEATEAELANPVPPMAAANDDVVHEAPAPSPAQAPAGAANDQAAKKRWINLEAVECAMKRFKYRPSPAGAEAATFVSSGFMRNVSFQHTPPALLKTTSNDMLAAQGMVAHAICSGWSPIRAEGTPEFMANVFHQAALMGVEVAGYTPTEADLRMLEKARIAIPAWVAETPAPINKLAPVTPGHQQDMPKAKAPRPATEPSMSM